ncbi:MAG: GH116 family glycosyl-hydrolase [Gammaproteobacteria bacterium]
MSTPSSPVSAFRYDGERQKEISFPLGGIGTGSIGLSGGGRLIDWEIFNRPNKGSTNGFSHFAVRAERGGKVVDARILNGPFLGAASGDAGNGFGFGARRGYLTSMPHFAECRFDGRFPVAEVEFHDARFPGVATLRAFNPLIPMQPDDSSLPAAFFEIDIENTGKAAADYTVIGVLGNPFGSSSRTVAVTQDGWSGARHETQGKPAGDPGEGALLLACDAEDISVQRQLFRGAWFDMPEAYWNDVLRGGRFEDRRYDGGRWARRDPDHTLVAAHFPLAPGERRRVRFLLAWYVPTFVKYWESESSNDTEKRTRPTWRNHYATLFPDVGTVTSTAFRRWSSLRERTFTFRDAFYQQTLPRSVIDAAGANISILKTPTVLRLEDGTFYGWEGLHSTWGVCEGSCTHVWNYQQTLPFLFPSLERSMREADFRYNMDPQTGGMSFRLQLPLGSPRTSVRPCVDGQFGSVLKTYRDWKISGDTTWLAREWPAVKAAIGFAWHEGNPDRWDPEKTGVLTGRQHHTLDMELFGPNSWLNGFYLGALKAGARMAAALGDVSAHDEYSALFERGRRWTNDNLFNGTHFVQRIDLADRTPIDRFASGPDAIVEGSMEELYWSEEHGQVRYQIGEGCLVDQVIGQWHADLYGLGDIFDRDKVVTALRTVYARNFKERLGDIYNPCRVYGFEDEAGTVICTWPEGTSKPAIPVPYAQETFHGFEYALGSTLMQHGLLFEGTKVFRAVRDRYDGSRRNPWNEMECGSNYARSMAAYAGVLVLSGFTFDLTRGYIGFDPKVRSGEEVCVFWAIENGWGLLRLRRGEARLIVLGGSLTIRELGLPLNAGVTAKVVIASAANSVITVQPGGILKFPAPVDMMEGREIRVASEGLRIAHLPEAGELEG